MTRLGLVTRPGDSARLLGPATRPGDSARRLGPACDWPDGSGEGPCAQTRHIRRACLAALPRRGTVRPDAPSCSPCPGTGWRHSCALLDAATCQRVLGCSGETRPDGSGEGLCHNV